MINEPKIVEITEIIDETPTIKTFKFNWDMETLGKPNPGEFLMVWNFKNEKPMSIAQINDCLLYTSPSPRDVEESRMPSSA